MIKKLSGCLYTPHPDYAENLHTELSRLTTNEIQGCGNSYFVPGPPLPTTWHLNIWLEPHEVTFSSIKDAADQLRLLGKLWSADPHCLFRKTELIQQRLPFLPSKPRKFPLPCPPGPLGSWKLINENTLWASPTCSSRFPSGLLTFEENKIDPPSSAYLKLWEALSVYGQYPQERELCLDAGSCPGGWTWVLAELGAQVESIDRAPIDDRLLKRKNVSFKVGNAFSLHPDHFTHLDWFCCDVICSPDKLFNWLEPWIHSGKVTHFIVTVKMKGEPDWETIKKFQTIPGSRLIHLFHNKNELTWLR